jgi:hypothetical protein
LKHKKKIIQKQTEQIARRGNNNQNQLFSHSPDARKSFASLAFPAKAR